MRYKGTFPKRYKDPSPVKRLGDLAGQGVESEAVRETGSPAISEERKIDQVVPTRIKEKRMIILVPEGTLSFMRPIIDDNTGLICGHEIVWLKPNELGIWEARGEGSGDLYIHESFYRREYERQRLVMESIEEQRVMEERAEFAQFVVRFWDAQRLTTRLRRWFRNHRAWLRLWLRQRRRR